MVPQRCAGCTGSGQPVLLQVQALAKCLCQGVAGALLQTAALGCSRDALSLGACSIVPAVTACGWPGG